MVGYVEVHVELTLYSSSGSNLNKIFKFKSFYLKKEYNA